MTQRVLISGGASGLGRELARAWAARGARVAIGDIHTERLAETFAELGEDHIALQLNVCEAESWAHAMSRLSDDWGGLDIVVNNAGIASGGTMQGENMAEWQRVIDINLLGVVRGCQAAQPLLAQSGGHILNVASMAGLIHPPMMGSYNAVKAAVVAYSETLAFELEPDNISVHVLCPGFFKTNLAESLQGDGPMRAVIDRIFERATVTAAEVAQAAIKGVEKGDHLILSHPEGRQIHRLKRLFPDTLYPRIMRKQTEGLMRAQRNQP